jgi:hypothetical protein
MLHAEDPTTADRVRHSTAPQVNREIDRQTNNNIRRYANASPEVITRRIEELDREWDVERALEVNASTLALTGLRLARRSTGNGWRYRPLYCHPAPARASGMVPAITYIAALRRTYAERNRPGKI